VADRSLKMDLRKNRVMLKRAMRRTGLTEEDLKTSSRKVMKNTEIDGTKSAVENDPEEIIPPEENVIETETANPEKNEALGE